MILRLATRRSKLALAQARAYVDTLKATDPTLQVEELHIVTTGDKIQDRPLQDLGGKGLFIKEVEEALLDRRASFAVHSIKDVPAELAPSLCLAAMPKREDPRDALLSREGASLADLPQGAKVGTSSLRRRTMLLRARPDLTILPLRGNVDTRLRKLAEGQVDAIVLAAAGLVRLGLAAQATEILEPDASLPAVGQGALGIECREDDEQVRALLATTDDQNTRICVTAERAFMAAVGGSCQLPVAAYAEREGTDLWLRGMFADADGSHARFGERRMPWSTDLTVIASLGRALGDALKG
ncbi:MAG: hydroxymethylbilane synthase [Deltaproteobacteria bacterium]|nr:MAG: hydroxymethylbilane synthase [Deltaproteobacteria bacterium]